MRATARSRQGSRPRPVIAVATLALLFLVAGCSSLLGGGSAEPGSASPDVAEPQDRIHRQAHDALVRWADAVRASGGATIVFTGELTDQIGDWANDEGDNKASLMSGLVEAANALPDDQPGRREVKWTDGSKIDVNVLSAAAALRALVETAGDGDCSGCPMLFATEASLATSLVDTSRGPAEVPTWVYSIQGSAVRITRVAVDESITVQPPAWNANDPPVGISIQSAAGSPDSRRLTVAFVGAPGDASKPCGADYTTEAVESELAVVVIVIEQRNPTPGACTAVGATRTAEVRLEARLGDRALLEVRQGLPITVSAP